ncbi:EFR1 family ferrodoxin [Bacteroides sp. OF04-15BH]|uniref:EFR1 family ferrodoxin n=1 Tax=Bacteroides sp. OF04-15BH TaxID=2292281 RepID=UPI000E53F5C3|nr:EFR1 family ferrodoxin [Bacteroides sp. OF04-15BH]RHP59080.1 4Fe-4S dicluster domain-containing protein [Bacteroides sp. OF04-15BH]
MKIYEITFSPTGGTKRVADFLSNELSRDITDIDLSNGNENLNKYSLTNEDTVIIAVPSYSGRVPSTAAERIAKIQGHDAKAIIVCVYGNRAYEDTLAELQDIVQQAGFIVISAIAAVAEHSIAHRYATNRPDKDDYGHLRVFAKQIGDKLRKNDFSTPTIPGNRPYRKAANAGIVPKATKACTQCGLCASKCPVGAIDKNNPEKVNKKACISCMRCVTVCPHHARKVNGLLLAIVNMMLKKACSIRKECELYI